MPYLNLDLDYFDHPKTRRLIGLLGKGSEVIPIRLWAYAGKYHAADGKLAGYSAQEIETVIGWWGEKGACINALIHVGFLRQDEHFFIHDWLEHEGHIIAFKEKARNMARKRWADAASNAASNAITNHTYLPTKRIEESFEEVWKKYPNKDGRKIALRHFKASIKTDADLKNFDIALKNYLASEKVKKGFIKNGSTFFNNWQDWIRVSAPMLNEAERENLTRQVRIAHEGIEKARKDLPFHQEQGNEKEIKRLTGNIKAYEHEIEQIEARLQG